MLNQSNSRWITSAVLVSLAALPRQVQAQDFTWKSGATFYGDNTEFFNPYRIGQTILGAQVQSYLSAAPGPKTEVILGFYGDHRSGRSDFFNEVKPLLGFRYRTATSLRALGTLVTENRHGYMEPLEVTTLEIVRPIEYGLQWREEHEAIGGEVFINWQHLNTRTSREIFDYGLLLHLRPRPYLELEFQGHGLHHGGQLYSAGVPVTNNQAGAVGVRLMGRLPLVGESSLACFKLASHGHIDPLVLEGRPKSGQGTYIRGSIAPRGWFELFAIQWWGRDFLSEEGDNSYNSRGADPQFYQSRRRYQEFGITKVMRVESGVTLDAEFRLHQFDNRRSIALGHSEWEYSYHLVLRAPFEVDLRRKD
jgi:hypothetical protein